MRILVGDAVPEVLLRSLAPAVRAIASAIGPDGRTVLSGNGSGVSRALTGVEIARAVIDGRGAGSVGPTLLKETLVEADRDLGDGTARLALIAASTFRAAWRRSAGRRASTGLADAVDALRPVIARHLDDRREDAPHPLAVALAAGADPALARQLADLFETVGPHGVIEVRDGRSDGLAVRCEPGFAFDAIRLPPSSATPVPDLADVHILAADDVIGDFGALAPVLDGFAVRGKSLVVVARDVVGPALAAIERNRAEGRASVVALKPADVGRRAADILADLAAATGATLLGGPDGATVAAARPFHLGRAGDFRLAGPIALLTGPVPDDAAVGRRLAEIGHEIRRSRHLALDRAHAERRRGRLAGQWADIETGAGDGIDARTRAVAARRAVACMRAGAEGGVVEGGGSALARIAAELEGEAGSVVAEGLRSVAERIALNASGADRPRTGGNAAAVPDPLTITRGVVDRALSLAANLMRVEAVVCR